jgi:hypothetical protein
MHDPQVRVERISGSTEGLLSDDEMTILPVTAYEVPEPRYVPLCESDK